MKRAVAKKLPSKPSALIRVALKDLEKAERSRAYSIDMLTWHDASGDRCTVCMAGAVMAYSLGVPRTCTIKPAETAFNSQLVGINLLRSGNVRAGLGSMGVRFPRAVPHYVDVPPYSIDKRGFKKSMRSMASMLARHGL